MDDTRKKSRRKGRRGAAPLVTKEERAILAEIAAGLHRQMLSLDRRDPRQKEIEAQLRHVNSDLGYMR